MAGIHLYFTIGLNGDMPGMKKIAEMDKNLDYSGTVVDNLDCIVKYLYASMLNLIMLVKGPF